MAGERERYGLGEWYGHIAANQAPEQLNRLAQKAGHAHRQANMPCPFRQASEADARCNKKGGVCSIQLHRQESSGVVTAAGKFVTTCPSRFWQNNNVFRWIGETVLGTDTPTLIKEVDFLESLSAQEADDQDEARDAVGRIDMVLTDPNNTREWCALEIQAVYFSGPAMHSYLAQFADPAITGLVFPEAIRRPDFRSSGPKRLMPQLQTKVPTLRRWGRKMTVVIDRSFFDSLRTMISIAHLSNADIAWFVVDYDPNTGAMSLTERVFTTLESSVEALTAGVPMSRDAFEQKLTQIITSNAKSMRRKVIRLA